MGGSLCAGGNRDNAQKFNRDDLEQMTHVNSKYLKDIPLLMNLSDTELENLTTNFKKRKYAEGAVIMKAGDQGSEFFIISAGRCAVKNPQGANVAELNKGDYCGEQALLSGSKRSATVIAVEDTVCLVLDRKTFDKTLGRGDRITFPKRNAVYTGIEEEASEPSSPRNYEKNPQLRKWMLEQLAKVKLFEVYEKEQLEACVQVMYQIPVRANQNLIVQGETDSNFYLLERGQVDVVRDNKLVVTLGKGECFGELALLHKTPRNATVTAKKPCICWTVGRQGFRRAVRNLYQGQDKANVKTLQKVEIFSVLLSNELTIIADALSQSTYERGATIIHEGDKAGQNAKFYIIKKGTATFHARSDGRRGEIKQHEYFGELAILNNEPRSATIKAKTRLTCLELTRQDFELLMGPLADILKQRASLYPSRVGGSSTAITAAQLNNAGIATSKPSNVCGLKELQRLGVLGRGAFGFVTLVMDPNTKKTYALKAIKKSILKETGQEELLLREKTVMQRMHHTSLVNLHRTYKDKRRLYLLLDACLGGEIFTLLRKQRYFSEDTSRFFSASVVEAFDYMHSQSIVYRDLKPENLVLNRNGYVKVADFGFAKFVMDKTYTLCGTPDYLAPEIVTGQGHGKGVDWWTVGVLIYELCSGVSPFYSSDQTEMYRKIVRGRFRTPKYFSDEAKDIIHRLLKNKPTKRLGVTRGGAKSIRRHPWFASFQWQEFRAETLPAPIKPKVQNDQDFSNFKQIKETDAKKAKAMTLSIDAEF